MGLDSAYGIGSLKQGVCTSSTRPAAPFEGQQIYETDTDKVLVYNGSAWYANWNTAWGQVGYVSRTTGDLSIAGATQDLTSMSITFTGVASRLYRASWLVNGSKNASDRDGTKVSFANSSNTDLAAVNLVTMGGTNIGLNFSGVATFTSTGSASFKLRAMSFSGTMTVFATSTNPMFFIIEDIGPA